MQTKEKVLLAIVCILLIVFALTFTFMKNSKIENNIENTKIDFLNKEYNIEGLNISNLELYTENDITKFNAKITNNTSNSIKVNNLTITLLNKDNDTLLEETILYNTILEPKNSQYISFYGNIALTDINDIKFSLTSE